MIKVNLYHQINQYYNHLPTFQKNRINNQKNLISLHKLNKKSSFCKYHNKIFNLKSFQWRISEKSMK